MKVGMALVLGLLTILTLALTLENQSIPLSENLVEIYKDFGFTIEAITFSIRPTVFIRPMIWVAILSLIAMLYPVLKVQRYTPVEALQRA
jgi:ABC-type antimicrobial peptide transport system permease subunit